MIARLFAADYMCRDIINALNFLSWPQILGTQASDVRPVVREGGMRQSCHVSPSMVKT